MINKTKLHTHTPSEIQMKTTKKPKLLEVRIMIRTGSQNTDYQESTDYNKSMPLPGITHS